MRDIDERRNTITRTPCKHCVDVAYCGEDCLAADWPRHLLECTGVAAAKAAAAAAYVEPTPEPFCQACVDAKQKSIDLGLYD